MKSLFLILSATVTLAAAIPYIIDILKRTTKPNIVSWITWTLLTGIATIAAFSAKEYTTAIFTGFVMLEVGAVVVLGLKYGYAKYTRFDAFCQIAALAGLVLWLVFNSPAVAVAAAVIVDLIGSLPTVKHSYQRPQEETWPTYALSALGGFFALLALSTYNWVSLPYAAYVVLANSVICGVIIYAGRRQITKGAV